MSYHVKGWGKIRNDFERFELRLDCVTDNFGPERHIQCRNYYKHEGKMGEGCQKTPSPSSKNKKCRLFKKYRGKNQSLPKKGESLKIQYKNSKGKLVSTKCYYMKSKVYQPYLRIF